jgi:rubrerythrin
VKKLSEEGTAMSLGILAMEALDFAIDNEQQSMRFYTDLAARAPGAEMRALFESLVREEQGHKSRLEAILKGGKLPEAGRKVLRLNLSDYVPDIASHDNLDYGQSLVVAMKKEAAAVHLYTDLAREVDDEELRQTFTFLAEEESRHRLRFEREYAALTGKTPGQVRGNGPN